MKGKCNMHSYIGTLINDSGTFDIADPMVNPIFCDQQSIPRENQTILKVRNSLFGAYDAWHILDDDFILKELLLIHNTYTFDNLNDNKPLNIGVVCDALAHAVCIVDERYHFDPNYCYYKLEKEAVYDGDEIIKRLPSSPYSTAIKSKLTSVISNLRENGKHPTGEDLYKVIKGHRMWDTFCSNKIYSSHWSVDVCNRIEGCFPAAIFKGGVISKSGSDFLQCYTYRNNRGMAFAIRIPLYMDENEEIKINKTNIIRFPER